MTARHRTRSTRKHDAEDAVSQRHTPFDWGRDAVRSDRERGSASILVMGIGLAVVLFGVASTWVGSAIIARHQAETAADLGALAGAQRSVLGDRAACARARRIVTANQGSLLACSLDGLDITVRVGVGALVLPGRFSLATATARAGPVRVLATGPPPVSLHI